MDIATNMIYYRERVAESLLLDGYCYKYDISLPLSVFYNAVLDMRERLGKLIFNKGTWYFLQTQILKPMICKPPE